ncbi:MAG: polyprenol monophosphomannose synthase [Candidatus Eisenbacteria bacterium]|uniref:Polyprenol monophosphomannose synthase n=1 Tax=Eiseniibacteriota bacterium TaxID=2212470 RepID=A0A948W7V1_UNCEI|nr:polyprenol monophosphomannose synthase [Candidatus Eisenbacteria bacterium]MBU1950400.1 polyprenol monophosphomannose synthase [Candidatus Eisenbacteria bacterium]MBU2692979.1 polyprenol monophosphomannose synthase [Candidatus Eisenbacteria bacterium]
MRTLVVIPTYNERENIQVVIPKILDHPYDLQILVVDDGSPDGTGQIVEEMGKSDPRISLLRRPGKMGLGSAYVAGFQRAIEMDVDCVIQMDADLSHDPQAIPEFIEGIKDSDLVVGSRYLNGVTVVNWPIRRLILSFGANLYTKIVTGMPLSDATGGFKCFRRSTLELIDLDKIGSDGYGFQIEMNFQCWRRNLRIREIPIVFVDRQKGASKLSRWIVWEAIWLVWRLALSRWFGSAPKADKGRS